MNMKPLLNVFFNGMVNPCIFCIFSFNLATDTETREETAQLVDLGNDDKALKVITYFRCIKTLGKTLASINQEQYNSTQVRSKSRKVGNFLQ